MCEATTTSPRQNKTRCLNSAIELGHLPTEVPIFSIYPLWAFPRQQQDGGGGSSPLLKTYTPLRKTQGERENYALRAAQPNRRILLLLLVPSAAVTYLAEPAQARSHLYPTEVRAYRGKRKPDL